MKHTFWLRVGISVSAALLIALRIWNPELKIDTITMGLLIVALLPWVYLCWQAPSSLEDGKSGFAIWQKPPTRSPYETPRALHLPGNNLATTLKKIRISLLSRYDSTSNVDSECSPESMVCKSRAQCC